MNVIHYPKYANISGVELSSKFKPNRFQKFIAWVFRLKLEAKPMYEFEVKTRLNNNSKLKVGHILVTLDGGVKFVIVDIYTYKTMEECNSYTLKTISPQCCVESLKYALSSGLVCAAHSWLEASELANSEEMY